MSHCGQALHPQHYGTEITDLRSVIACLILSLRSQTQIHLAFVWSFLDIHLFDLRGYLAAIAMLIVEFNCNSYLRSCVSLVNLYYVAPVYTCTDLNISCHKALFTKLKSSYAFNNFDLMLHQPRPLVLDLTNLYMEERLAICSIITLIL